MTKWIAILVLVPALLLVLMACDAGEPSGPPSADRVAATPTLTPVPADAPSGGEAQVGSGLSETGTTPGDDTPAEGGTSGETPATAPVGGGGDTSQTAADAYLALCGEADQRFGDSLEELSSFREAAVLHVDAIELWESVEPPEEYADLHDAYVAFLRNMHRVLNDGPGEDASEDEVDEYVNESVLPVLLRYAREQTEIVRDMSRNAIAGFYEAGCIDEADLKEIFTEAEIEELRLGEPTEFTSVSAGEHHTCGVRIDGVVECWGGNLDGQATPPDGEFASVSAGYYHTCGVRIDGSVECWGRNDEGQATPPDGGFASVSGGHSHTCGVRPNGSVECWGSNDEEQSTPPDGAFASVSAAVRHTCGLKPDGVVECWGSGGRFRTPKGVLASISAGGGHTCGVLTDGWIQCAGSDERGEATPPDGVFISVSAGAGYTCGVRADGSVECWGADALARGAATPPDGAFNSVSAGRFHACGVRADGSVECWGGNSARQITPPGERRLSWP